jgi:hypothetical protein
MYRVAFYSFIHEYMSDQMKGDTRGVTEIRSRVKRRNKCIWDEKSDEITHEKSKAKTVARVVRVDLVLHQQAVLDILA